MTTSLQSVEKALIVEAPAAETIKLETQDLSFYYGDHKSLHEVSIPFADKAVTALIGPSGCGKSTLLRALNRIYNLYPGHRAEGQIILDGKDILARGADIAGLRTKVGMVFQKPTPFPMSIYDNVAFGVRLYENISKAELDNRVEEALRRAALWDEVKDKLKRPGTGLSGGQQQRLCVARGVAVRPDEGAAGEDAGRPRGKTAGRCGGRSAERSAGEGRRHRAGDLRDQRGEHDGPV